MDIVPADMKILMVLNKDTPISITGKGIRGGVSKRVNITESHVFRLIKKLEKEKLIKTRKKGRERLALLTSKGEKVRDAYKLYLKLRYEYNKKHV